MYIEKSPAKINLVLVENYEIETINDIFKKSIKKTDGYIKGVILF